MSQLTSPARTVIIYEVVGNNANYSLTLPNWISSGPPYGDIVNEGTYFVGESPGGDGVLGTASTSQPIGGGQFLGGGPLRYATGPMIYSFQAGGEPVSASFSDPVNGLHLGGSNFIMADGHSKWFKPSQVSAGSSAATTGSCELAPYAGNTTAASTDEPSCYGAPISATFSLI
jgi:prepilin-type processing-associated H-X9-DG protein